MPLDIALLRSDPEKVRESQRRRFAPVELVDQVLAKDEEWKTAMNAKEMLAQQRNEVQNAIKAKKKAKEPCDDLIAQIPEFKKKVKELEDSVAPLVEARDKLLAQIGNLVDDTVPVSQDEEKHSDLVKTVGPCPKGAFLHHHEVLWRIGGYEPEAGAKVAGHRGYFLTDMGLLLNQALINYGIAFLRARESPYKVMQPPYFMNKDIMAGVAQLEQFDEELYHVKGDDEKYLIATSEQPICGYHQNETFTETQLAGSPIKYGGCSTCFRKEAGKSGKDIWGIFRVHQFEKVEQFIICHPDESWAVHEEMLQQAKTFTESLGLPYR